MAYQNTRTFLHYRSVLPLCQRFGLLFRLGLEFSEVSALCELCADFSLPSLCIYCAHCSLHCSNVSFTLLRTIRLKFIRSLISHGLWKVFSTRRETIAKQYQHHGHIVEGEKCANEGEKQQQKNTSKMLNSKPRTNQWTCWVHYTFWLSHVNWNSMFLTALKVKTFRITFIFGIFFSLVICVDQKGNRRERKREERNIQTTEYMHIKSTFQRITFEVHGRYLFFFCLLFGVPV